MEVTIAPVKTTEPVAVATWVDPSDPTEGGKYPLRGSQPYRYDDPFGPAWDPDEWEMEQ